MALVKNSRRKVELSIMEVVFKLFKSNMTSLGIYLYECILNIIFELKGIWSFVHSIKNSLFHSGEYQEIREWLEKHLMTVPDDFSESWQDGKLLIALLNKLAPGCYPVTDEIELNDNSQNIKIALEILYYHFNVQTRISTSDIAFAKDDTKLLSLLAELKTEYENRRKSEELTSKHENKKDDEKRRISKSNCIAKGTGLMVGYVNRLASFVIYCASISDLDLLIDIRGPSDTSCCERITSKSPRKKECLKPWKSDAFKSHRETSSESSEVYTKIIPLEYEIRFNQINCSFIPLQKGQHKLSILWRGYHIQDSPYTVMIETGLGAYRKNATMGLKSILKMTTGGSNLVIDSESGTLKFEESRGKRGCRVVRKRVLKYIVKVAGKDVVVNTDCIKNLATSLLKMDYQIQRGPLQRRNSWGFDGDTGRKVSFIRQFAINFDDPESHKRRINRSQSLSPESRNGKSYTRRISLYECENICNTIKLKTVTEGTVMNFDEHMDIQGEFDSTKEFENKSLTYQKTYSSNSNKDDCTFFQNNPSDIHILSKDKASIENNNKRESDSLFIDDRNSGEDKDNERIYIQNVPSDHLCHENENSDRQNTINIINLFHSKPTSEVHDHDYSAMNNLKDHTKEHLFSINGTQYDFEANENDQVVIENTIRQLTENEMKEEKCLLNDIDNITMRTHSNQIAILHRDVKTNSFRNSRKFHKSRIPRFINLLPHSSSKVTDRITTYNFTNNNCNYERNLLANKVKSPIERKILSDSVKEKCKTSNNDHCDYNCKYEKKVYDEIKSNNIAKYMCDDHKLSIDGNNNPLNQNVNAKNVKELSCCNDSGKNNQVSGGKLTLVSEEKAKYESTLNDFNSAYLSNEIDKSESQNAPISSKSNLNSYLKPKSMNSEKNTPIVKSKNLDSENEKSVCSEDLFTNEVTKYRQDNSSFDENCKYSQADYLTCLGQLNFKLFNPRPAESRPSLIKNRIRKLELGIAKTMHKCDIKKVIVESVDVKSKIKFWETAYHTKSSNNVTYGKNEVTALNVGKNAICTFNAEKLNHSGENLKTLQDTSSDLAFFKNQPSMRSYDQINIKTNKCRKGTSVSLEHEGSKEVLRSTFWSNTHKRSRSDPGALNAFISDEDLSPSRTSTKSFGGKSHQYSSREFLNSSNEYSCLRYSCSDDEDDFSSRALPSTEDEYIDDEIFSDSSTYWGDLSLIESLKEMSQFKNSMHCNESKIMKNTRSEPTSHPSKCQLFGIAAYYGYVALKNRFQVLTADAGCGTLSASVQGMGRHDVCKVTVEYLRRDVYEVTYQVSLPGLYLVSVQWRDRHIPGSPFICRVTY